MVKLPLAILVAVVSSVSAASSTLGKGLKVLENPTNAVNSLCDTDNPPAWCRDLFKSVCEVKKVANNTPLLQKEIDAKTQAKGTDLKSKNDSKEASIKMGDSEVYRLSFVERMDIQNAFNETKASLSSSLISDKKIPIGKKYEFMTIVNSIKLRTGYEYVEDLIAYGKKASPNTPIESIRAGAMEAYTSTCGKSGLEVNAFYEEGSVVLCPGLIYSLKDYSPKGKAEVLTALKFTIGHELTHSIDYSTHPSAYENMKQCFETLDGRPNDWQDDKAAEATSDFWGARALGFAMKNQGLEGEAAIRQIALAIDGLCIDPSMNSPHPEGKFRINNIIGKNPEVRKALGCTNTNILTPSCDFGGMSSD